MKKFLVLVFLSFGVQAELAVESLGAEFLRVERSAQKVSGFYHTFNLDQGKTIEEKIKVDSCDFLYERGERLTNNQTYSFENFLISFSGSSKKGETSFDSVTFSHSKLKPLFKPLDLSVTGHHTLTRADHPGEEKKFAAKLFGAGHNMDLGIAAKTKRPGRNSVDLEAIRGTDGSLTLNFTKVTEYGDDLQNSLFFKEGESRTYTAKVVFSKFDKKSIVLNKVEVKSKRRIGSKTKELVNTICDNFTESSDD